MNLAGRLRQKEEELMAMEEAKEDAENDRDKFEKVIFRPSKLYFYLVRSSFRNVRL